MIRRHATFFTTFFTTYFANGIAMFFATGLLTFALAPAAQAQEMKEARRIEQSFRPADSRALRLDLSFGKVMVLGEDRDDIAIEIVLSCPSGRDQATCQQRAQRLVLEARNRAKNLVVRLRRTPRARAHGIRSIMTVRVPSDQDLEVDIRVGSVEINGMKSDIEVDIGTGDTTIFFPQERIEYVKAAVSFGHANLWLADESNIQATGWPRSLTWRAAGSSRIEVDTGSGNIAVRLID